MIWCDMTWHICYIRYMICYVTQYDIWHIWYMVTLQLSYREQSLYGCHVQINIRCLYPYKGHMYSYTLLMMKRTKINFVNVAYLWGFNWAGLQARWLGFDPPHNGIFPPCCDVLSALVFTQHHYNSKAWRHTAEFAHLMPRCHHVMVLMLGTETDYVYCVFSWLCFLYLWMHYPQCVLCKLRGGRYVKTLC